jgi:hypothetical protein
MANICRLSLDRRSGRRVLRQRFSGQFDAAIRALSVVRAGFEGLAFEGGDARFLAAPITITVAIIAAAISIAIPVSPTAASSIK